MGLPAPVHKLVGPEGVRLQSAPGQIQPFEALIFRPYAILPAIAGDKVPSRITHDRHPQFTHQFQDVLTKSMLVRSGMVRLIDSSIDMPPQMLGKSSKKPRIYFRDNKITIQD